MFCPKCSQQQTAENIRFCSRCGFLLTGVHELLANNGLFPQTLVVKHAVSKPTYKQLSPRQKGIRQGIFIMLLMFLFAPILTILTDRTTLRDILPPLAAAICLMGGLMRLLFAVFFQDNIPAFDSLNNSIPTQNFNQSVFTPDQARNANALQPQPTDFVPTNQTYAPPYFRPETTTNEFATPVSITEDTTRLLQND